MLGNAVVRRFRLNNVVLPDILAVTTAAVPIAVTTGMVAVGDIGFAVPVGAAFTAGLSPMIPVVATGVAEITLYVANASAGAINPVDTFDFNVIMFPQVGNIDQTV